MLFASIRYSLKASLSRFQEQMRAIVDKKEITGFQAAEIYTDDHFKFVQYGYQKEVPAARPSLNVYSIKRDKWLQIDGVPTVDAISLGYSVPMSSVDFDYRRYKNEDFVPLGEQAYAQLTSPRISLSKDAEAYIFLYYHGEDSNGEDSNGKQVQTELIVRKKYLNEAFDRAFGDLK